jgi:hypothetical protein
MSNVSEGKSVMVTGRIVWTCGRTVFDGKLNVDDRTKLPKLNAKGEQTQQYGFGLAVAKTELAPGKSGEPLWNAIHEQAFVIYPSRQMPPAFAWKYKDGDGVDHNGAPFNTREGYGGHLIFACTTGIPIKFFRFENGNNILTNEGIKCGDYVNVQINVVAHAAVGQGKPGVYLNPNAVQFLGYGKEIINTPSGDQLFGVQAPPLPPGASATPLAPQPGMLVPQAPVGYAAPPQQPTGFPAPSAPQQFQAPQGYPGPGPSASPGSPPPPSNYGVIPPALQPPTQGYAQPGVPAGYPPAHQNGAPQMPGGFPPYNPPR